MVEEHLAAGGASAAVALALAGWWTGTLLCHAIEPVNPPVGDRGELMAFYGITADSVCERIAAAAPAMVSGAALAPSGKRGPSTCAV